MMMKHLTETMDTIRLEQLSDTHYILNELDTNDEEKDKLQHEIETLRNELMTVKDENDILRKKLAEHELTESSKKSYAEQSNKNQDLSNKALTNEDIRNKDIRSNIIDNRDSMITDMKAKNKICIISSNKRNKIKQFVEKIFGNKYDFCHHLKPEVGVDSLLKDIDKKLIGYTKRDCCYIMVGETDFLQTKDYVEMVADIRKKLELTRNTNIVLCLPTYKLGINYTLFNNRIENFNNLAYHDAKLHQHMYTFDTNFVLSDDYTMFNKRYGNVNDFGMNTIFDDLREWAISYQKLQPTREIRNK